MQEGSETVRLIQEASGEAVFRPTDVTQPSQVASLIQTTMETFGRLDFAFNNAGTEGTLGPLIDLPDCAWGQTLDTNLKSVWLCLKYELRAMKKQGAGAIVNNSTNITQVGIPGTSIYAASKGGVDALTRVAAAESASQGIRVNAVNPGFVATPMVSRIFNDPAAVERLSSGNPLGKIASSEDIARAVVWLCSPDAGHITGQTLNIDGGFTILR
jgi:NAD(P)-dependent dehydrogenase (short-subunit alcohol dehydrogenase family)